MRNVSNSTSHRSTTLKRISLIAGPVAAIVLYFLLDELPQGGGRVTAAVGILMAIWWLTEAIPIAATALIPLVLFPILGAASVKDAAAPYSHEVIFLFMGGFLIAQAMQNWRLHKRLALQTIRFVGTKTTMLVAGFMAATAFLSMWVSNTATVVMMFPIALSVIESIEPYLVISEKKGRRANPPTRYFSICLMLGVAYAASIGGITTLIGTPPNALLAAFMDQQYGRTFSFASWFIMALPLTLIFLPLAWFILTRLLFPIQNFHTPGAEKYIDDEINKLGPMKRSECSVLVVFILTAFLWMTHPVLSDLPGLSLDDSSIAIFGALLLFILPAGGDKGERLLDWESAKKIPWGVLVLFGGGLSLASGMSRNGVAAFIGNQFHGVGQIHPFWITLLVVLVVIFLTEIMSNTALVATFLPILAGVAAGFGVNPVLLLLPATLAASFAFMMPVATPPNAIVFSSGYISIPQMAKAGLVLNVIGTLLISVYIYFFADFFVGL